MKPIDKATFGMVSESSGHNESEPWELYKKLGRRTRVVLSGSRSPEDFIGVGGSDGDSNLGRARLDGRILERELVSSVERPAIRNRA